MDAFLVHARHDAYPTLPCRPAISNLCILSVQIDTLKSNVRKAEAEVEWLDEQLAAKTKKQLV